jgi:hypothetical protein
MRTCGLLKSDGMKTERKGSLYIGADGKRQCEDSNVWIQYPLAWTG